MDLKTALIHYKEGTASDSERRFVEEELEKTQLIADYLEEAWKNDFEEPDIPMHEYKTIRRTIARRNAALIFTSLILVFSIFAGFIKIAIPVLEEHYWDPFSASHSESFTDLEFTLKSYSELFVPNQTVYSIKTTKTGFASYNLSVTFAQWRDRYRLTHYNANLIRGTLTLPEGIWEYPESWSFKLDDSEAGSGYFNTAKKSMQNLPEYVMVRAYVTFPEDMDMEGVMALFRRVGSTKRDNPGIINWIGIRAKADDEDIYPLCGMKPFWSYDYGRLGSINESYPYLSIFDAHRPMASSEAITQHFYSLLRYSIDRVEQGTGILPESELGDGYYETVLDYVAEKGVYSYGCSITATPNTFLELIEDGTISAVSIQDAWITF